MRRTTLLISAAATAFSLVIVASVVYAYGVMAAPRSAVALGNREDPAAASGASAPVQVVPAASLTVSPQDAAALASKFLNRTDAYSVELADFSGAQAYKITFSSGEIVYVAMNGQILGLGPAPTTVTASTSTRGPRIGSGSESSESGGSGSGEHEDSGSEPGESGE